MKHQNSFHPVALCLLLIFAFLPAGPLSAKGSHPGDEPVPVPGDFPEGTAVRIVDPYYLNLEAECVPKIPDPIGPVTFLAGHWNDAEVDTVAGYDVASCTFFSPEELCDQEPELLGSSLTPLVGDWEGDGIDTLAFFDSDACQLRDPSDFEPGELPEPDADEWRFLSGDWEGRGVDSIAVARPEKIGDGAGGLLLFGNFDGSGDTFGIFDPKTGFAFYGPAAATKDLFDPSCYEWEVENWYVRITGTESTQICLIRTCCLGVACYDHLITK